MRRRFINLVLGVGGNSNYPEIGYVSMPAPLTKQGCSQLKCGGNYTYAQQRTVSQSPATGKPEFIANQAGPVVIEQASGASNPVPVYTKTLPPGPANIPASSISGTACVTTLEDPFRMECAYSVSTFESPPDGKHKPHNSTGVWEYVALEYDLSSCQVLKMRAVGRSAARYADGSTEQSLAGPWQIVINNELLPDEAKQLELLYGVNASLDQAENILPGGALIGYASLNPPPIAGNVCTEPKWGGSYTGADRLFGSSVTVGADGPNFQSIQTDGNFAAFIEATNSSVSPKSYIYNSLNPDIALTVQQRGLCQPEPGKPFALDCRLTSFDGTNPATASGVIQALTYDLRTCAVLTATFVGSRSVSTPTGSMETAVLGVLVNAKALPQRSAQLKELYVTSDADVGQAPAGSAGGATVEEDAPSEPTRSEDDGPTGGESLASSDLTSED